MKASELRIGNYVLRQSDKMIVSKTAIYQIENVNLQSAQKYEPIPLTETVLLNCNIEKLDKGLFSLGEETQLTYKGDGYNVDVGGVVIAFVIYLHQLQNLYFALTNKELTYDTK